MTNIAITKTNLCFRQKLNANVYNHPGRSNLRNDAVGMVVNWCG